MAARERRKLRTLAGESGPATFRLMANLSTAAFELCGANMVYD
jgi:hypothetical protein